MRVLSAAAIPRRPTHVLPAAGPTLFFFCSFVRSSPHSAARLAPSDGSEVDTSSATWHSRRFTPFHLIKWLPFGLAARMWLRDGGLMHSP